LHVISYPVGMIFKGEALLHVGCVSVGVHAHLAKSVTSMLFMWMHARVDSASCLFMAVSPDIDLGVCGRLCSGIVKQLRKRHSPFYSPRLRNYGSGDFFGVVCI